MGTFHIADKLDERLKNQSPRELKKELTNVYRQLVPTREKDGAIWGRYCEYRSEFKHSPALVHSLLLLLLDSGLSKEYKTVKDRFYKEQEPPVLSAPLTERERNRLVGYVNTTFSEIAFQRRYGIHPPEQQVV